MREILAIGGSAGSIQVIRQICMLPADLHASVVIAVHVGAGNKNLLAGILDDVGPLPASTAANPLETTAATFRATALEVGRPIVLGQPR